MSRFSPNTLIDAVTVPFALVQFRSNVYVETIAPDARPAVFIGLMAVLFVALAIRRIRSTSSNDKKALDSKLNSGAMAELKSRRAALAVMWATMITLFAWIISSANGRYGLLPLGLSGLGVAALSVLLFRRKTALVIVAAALLIQCVLLWSSDIDDSWSRLTSARWSEASALSYPETTTEQLGLAKDPGVVVVSTRTLTSMSAAWYLFGSAPTYIGGAYIAEAFDADSETRKRARSAIAQARDLYAIFSVEERNERESHRVPRLGQGDLDRLLTLGLIANPMRPCISAPARLGVELVVCPLEKTTLIRAPLKQIDQPARLLARQIEQACPNLFGDMREPMSDGAGGVGTQTQDGKYSIEISKNLKVYGKTRSELNLRLIFDGAPPFDAKTIIEKCKLFSPAGTQYFR